MDRITYIEAATILERPYESIKQAVQRGSLTRCIAPVRPAYLIKEQVLLFKGRKQISTRLLKGDDLQLWNMCRDEANTVVHATDSDFLDLPDDTAEEKGLGNKIMSMLFDSKLTKKDLQSPSMQFHFQFYTLVDRIRRGDKDIEEKMLHGLYELAKRSDISAAFTKIFLLEKVLGREAIENIVQDAEEEEEE